MKRADGTAARIVGRESSALASNDRLDFIGRDRQPDRTGTDPHSRSQTPAYRYSPKGVGLIPFATGRAAQRDQDSRGNPSTGRAGSDNLALRPPHRPEPATKAWPACPAAPRSWLQSLPDGGQPTPLHRHWRDPDPRTAPEARGSPRSRTPDPAPGQ